VDIAWRIPFLLGGILAIASYYIRKNIAETPEFLITINSSVKSDHSLLQPLKILLKTNIFGILVGTGLAFFIATLIIINLYFPVYINKYFVYELSEIYSAMSVSMVTSFFFMLFFGYLSDRISKVKTLFWVPLGFGCSLIPLYYLLSYKTFYALQLFFIIYQMWIAAFFTSYLPVLSRLFSTNTRCTGTALAYNIAVSSASFIPTLNTYFFASADSPAYLGIFFIAAILGALCSVVALAFYHSDNYIY
jgi:MFS family permease